MANAGSGMATAGSGIIKAKPIGLSAEGSTSQKPRDNEGAEALIDGTGKLVNQD